MRTVVLLAVVGLACTSKESSEPTEVFPAAAGKYHFSGDVTGDPPESHIAGTITLTQASLSDGDLGGTGLATGSFLANLSVSVTDPSVDAHISPSGAISFTLADANGSWSFAANLVGSSLQNGSHSLILANGGQITGSFTGSRASASAKPGSKP